MRGCGKQKAAGSGGLVGMGVPSHHMTKGRRFMGFGTSPEPMRAHVQNSAVAVSAAIGLRIEINGAPLFDGAIIAQPHVIRQAN
jgi:hypothetical protein